MTLSGRCGWYFRVIEEGVAPGPLARVVESGGPTVREAFVAEANRRVGENERRPIAGHPAMARAFRVSLLRR
jgi:MOSC domain-containing protein YiiM